MLMRTIVRICLIEAITGRTLPCDIRDSEIAIYDPNNFPKSDTPFCGVYTDKDDELTLVLGVTLGAAKRPEGGPDDEFVSPAIETGLPGTTSRMPATDLGLEMTIDALEYQIIQALKSPDNVWADLLKQGANLDLDDRVSVRGTLRTKDSAERLAGREIRISMAPLPDLDVGQELPEQGFWPDMFAALETSEIYTPFKESYERMIFGETRPDWQRTFAEVTLNAASVAALGQLDVEPNA